MCLLSKVHSVGKFNVNEFLRPAPDIELQVVPTGIKLTKKLGKL